MSKMAPNPWALVTVETAAEWSELSTRQIERLISEGSIPTWRPSPRVVRIPYFALLQHIAKQHGLEVAAPPLPASDAPLQSRS
ncbi:MAG: hypothetical protein AB7E70_20235 [Hyphomicrobiaceae bacterium]